MLELLGVERHAPMMSDGAGSWQAESVVSCADDDGFRTDVPGSAAGSGW